MEEMQETSLIRRLGRSSGEGNGNPLQYCCLGNPMDRGAWWATVHRVAKSRTRLKRFITAPIPLCDVYLCYTLTRAPQR